MRQALGLIAASLLGGLPFALWPEWHIGLAGIAATLTAAGGVLLPSLGLATAGAMFGLLVFAIALLVVPPGSALPASLLMGAMVLSVLELSALGERAQGSGPGPGVLGAMLGRLGTVLALAASVAFLLAIWTVFLPLGWSGDFRPLVGLSGVLIAFAAVVLPLLQPYTMNSIRNRPRRESK